MDALAAEKIDSLSTGDPYQKVLRAVALAIADQTNDETLILDWINRNRESELVEANLKMWDRYHNGRRAVPGDGDVVSEPRPLHIER